MGSVFTPSSANDAVMDAHICKLELPWTHIEYSIQSSRAGIAQGHELYKPGKAAKISPEVLADVASLADVAAQTMSC